jgi:hypothetical protein
MADDKLTSTSMTKTPAAGDYTPPVLTAYGRLEVDTAAIVGGGDDGSLGQYST